MEIIWCRAAKLIVWNNRPEAGLGRTRWKILEETTPAQVANDDIELTVSPKSDDTAIMVATFGLALIILTGRSRSANRFEKRAA
jgi:hypothetical protein